MEKNQNQVASQPRNYSPKPIGISDARYMAEVLMEMGKMNAEFVAFGDQQTQRIEDIIRENICLERTNDALETKVKRYDESLTKMTAEVNRERERNKELSKNLNPQLQAKIDLQTERIGDLMALLTEERLMFKKQRDELNASIEARNAQLREDGRKIKDLQEEGQRLAEIGRKLENELKAKKKSKRKK